MDPREPIVDAYTSQEYSKCVTLIETAPSEISSQTDMRILQASCLININGRSGEAHQILDKILELEPRNGLAFYGKGLAFLKESNLEKSFENFSKAADLDKTGVISKAQVMKLKTEEMLKAKRTSKRLSGKQKKEKAAPITCEICNRSFAQLFSLNRHKLIHSCERPHKCLICNFGFVQKSDLQRHMSVHNENADFPCQSCEKKFKSKKNLSLHLLTHSVERPFKCETCGKDFKYRRLMKLHQIIHSKRKKYNCDFCEKIFVTKPSLKAHVMMHINKKNKEGVRLSGEGGIVENFEVSSGNLGMEMMNVKVEEKMELDVQHKEETMDVTLKLEEVDQVTSNLEESENVTSKSTEPVPTASENVEKSSKSKIYSKKKQQELENSNNEPGNQNQDSIQSTAKKPRGRPPKDARKSSNFVPNVPQQPVQADPIPSTSTQALSTSPQAVRNSVRIQNRKSLGTNRSFIKTNPKSTTIRRESLGSTANIQQDHNLGLNQSSSSANPDQIFSTSALNISELFPQISIISNNTKQSEPQNTAATRFSLNNIELPPSLQIRPILGIQGSKIRNQRNSTSGSEAATQLNLIPPTKFINTSTSSPAIPAHTDPRISAIFSNPHISVAITSTSSSAAIAKSKINSSPTPTDSKWSPNQAQVCPIPIEDIKLEPVEVQENDQQDENLSSHDSLFSSENEHPSEWNLFFKSLMHDLSKMDERQKRKFKQKTFMVIDDILQ